MADIETVQVNINSRKKEVKRAALVMEKTYKTVSSLNSIYRSLQSDRASGTGRRGITEKESDILRSMLVFSASGLDAVTKQLIKEALPGVIYKHEGAQRKLEGFLNSKLKVKGNDGDDLIDIKTISSILSASSPVDKVRQLLIKELTSHSLQSTEEVLKVASYFDIESSLICNDTKTLTDAFNARNYIIHDMDVDFSSIVKRRRPRGLKAISKYINLILSVSVNFINSVENKLK